jgi:hypothetical protein
MSVAVESLLIDLGFVPNDGQHGPSGSVLSFDFGNLILTATPVANRWMQDVWSFGGVANDSRSLAHIEFEMPLAVESVEQGTAWIAEHVNGQVSLRHVPKWLEIGLSWRDELPWRKELNRYNERPLCRVEREWFRLPCKALRLAAEEARADERAELSFDGTVLRVALPNKVVAVPASGERWNQTVAVLLTELRHLPRRLMSQSVEVSHLQDHLTIGRLRLPLLDHYAAVSPSR